MDSENYSKSHFSPLNFLIDGSEVHMFPRFRSLQGKAISWHAILKLTLFLVGASLPGPPILLFYFMPVLLALSSIFKAFLNPLLGKVGLHK